MPVYMIRAGETDKVKIGFAADVQDRIATLQTAHWERLFLIRTWEGDKVTERWLHQQFAASRIEREWFVFDPAMMTIETLDLSALRKAPTDDPDPILPDIDTFLLKHDMTATAFGKASAGDPMLVHEMRHGRELRKATRARIRDFIGAFAAAVQPQTSEGV